MSFSMPPGSIRVFDDVYLAAAERGHLVNVTAQQLRAELRRQQGFAPREP